MSVVGDKYPPHAGPMSGEVNTHPLGTRPSEYPPQYSLPEYSPLGTHPLGTQPRYSPSGYPLSTHPGHIYPSEYSPPLDIPIPRGDLGPGIIIPLQKGPGTTDAHPYLSPREQTDDSENITFPQLRWRAVIISTEPRYLPPWKSVFLVDK